MKRKSPLLTAANIVTVVRIIFIPVFIFILLAPWPRWFPDWGQGTMYQPWLAAAVYTLLATTDAVDGYLARSRQEVTTLGKFLDPLADKILVCAALIALCELGTMPSWIAILILAREFIVSGLRMVASVEGIVIAASWYGKVKTVVTIIAIIMFIVKGSAFIEAMGPILANAFNYLSWFVMIVALLLTIISMVDYFAKANEAMDLFAPPLDNNEISQKGGECEQKSKTPADNITIINTKIEPNKLIKFATSLGITISTAESCTGGLIGSCLTSVPGSSEVFLGGIISYDNSIKRDLLGVSEEDLQKYGAVSEQVAVQMACGARKYLGSDLSISVTGVAGPDGGTAFTPVGTVWFAVASSRGCFAFVEHFAGSRDAVREATVDTALRLLYDECLACSKNH